MSFKDQLWFNFILLYIYVCVCVCVYKGTELFVEEHDLLEHVI